MTQDEAAKTANDNIHLVGQRWKNNTDGTIETVIEVRPIQLRQVDYAWTVMVVFIPTIDKNHIGKIREHFLDTFFDNYTKLI